jgi:hypothetical protein
MESEPSPPTVTSAINAVLGKTRHQLIGAVALAQAAVRVAHRKVERIALVGRAQNGAAQV